ncbi:MAG: cation diffusion facilitator family transporter [Bacteroidetes bacterium]|nr:cation diffusion facilitator family transporter [Bacteroidota bacterium]
MAHEHHHHHHHPAPTKVNTAFLVGIALNSSFVVVEAVLGFWTNSLSLLSDAGHNLADVASLALSLLAFRLLKVKNNAQYTYGYRKTSVLVALFNSVVLLVSIGAILIEAFQRLWNPHNVPGETVALVAGVGILINAGSAFLFFRDRDQDLNLKSAYLHLLSDALVSFGLVVGGLVLYYTHWYWMDSALSIVISIIILWSTWRLLLNSLRLSLDGVPTDIQLPRIKAIAESFQGVIGIHHIHVWAISTTENAMTAHLVLQERLGMDEECLLKQNLKHAYLHENIHHVTLETERENQICHALDC